MRNNSKAAVKHALTGTPHGLTIICRFMVRHVRTMKYMTRIGQNTGTSKTSKKVQKNAKVVDFMVDNLGWPTFQ